jgi:hypothetical protein
MMHLRLIDAPHARGEDCAAYKNRHHSRYDLIKRAANPTIRYELRAGSVSCHFHEIVERHDNYEKFVALKCNQYYLRTVLARRGLTVFFFVTTRFFFGAVRDLRVAAVLRLIHVGA